MEERTSGGRPLSDQNIQSMNYEFLLSFTTMIMSKTYIAFSTQLQTPQGVANDQDGLMSYSVSAIKRACQRMMIPTSYRTSWLVAEAFCRSFSERRAYLMISMPFVSSDMSTSRSDYTPWGSDLVVFVAPG